MRSSLYFSYLLFINNFDVYRNIYRTLKAFYLIPVYLKYTKRKKLANIFILSLRPYNINIKDVVEVFSKSLR